MENQESTYTGEVSWKDFLDEAEAAELQDAERAKASAVEQYNSLRRLLKSRCDARMRRAKVSDDPQASRARSKE